MSKFIFITGGVISSIGKSIITASLALILKTKKNKITIIKIDPYININSRTISPLQHGEIFVTDDGFESNLDFGYYERFLNQKMKKNNNITTGQIYKSVIKKERKGKYLGQTVQIIPHIVNEIKNLILKKKNFDIILIEIGGTIGDIELLPFLEAIRQLNIEIGFQNTIFVHLTLIPFLESSIKLKTKPTQHSILKLRELGIIPEILICRSKKKIFKKEFKKISLFSNISLNSIFSIYDVKNIYKIPKILYKNNINKIIYKKFNLKPININLNFLNKIILHSKKKTNIIYIAIIIKYINFLDAYKSLSEALYHAGIYTNSYVKIKYINLKNIKLNKNLNLNKYNGIIIPGEFEEKEIEEKISIIKFARKNKKPFLGICLGMQIALIEFSRNILGFKNANSTEFDLNTKHPIIILNNNNINNNLNFKGILRLGAKTCKIKPGTLAEKIYGKQFTERHRHKYIVNNLYYKIFKKAGLIISSKTIKDNLCEIIELPQKKNNKNNLFHPWYLGVQFHPEFKSNPRKGHPLFISFLKAALKNKMGL